MRSLIDGYSKEALEKIVSVSMSMAELVKNLGYKTTHGKNYETVMRKLQRLNISTDHFVVQRVNKIITEQEIFCKDSTVSQSTVRRAYLKLPVDYKCSECGIEGMWNGKCLSLQLDHIDGDNKNNLIENLRWLCPNCHSQTKTFAGKNATSTQVVERKLYYCVDCGKEISRGSSRCSECSSISRRKVQRPSKDDLASLMKAHNCNFAAVGKIYNVRDNTVRKWCKFYGIMDEITDYKKPRIKRNKQSIMTYAVDQVDMVTGEVVASFASQKEAEKQTGIFHIYEASDPNNTKRRSAGGYFWIRK